LSGRAGREISATMAINISSIAMFALRARERPKRFAAHQ
jgi:hypothetical protein